MSRYLMSLLLVAFFNLTSCASLNFTNLVESRNTLALDESKRAQETLQQLQYNGVFIEIDNFETIVSNLQKVLYPDEMPISVRVVRMPGENAFALPNGFVLVHLGLLATLENLEQLAFVLAHEIAHIKLNHGYLGASHRRTQRIASHMSDIVTFGMTNSHTRYIRNISSHARDTEYAADEQASITLEKAGFSLAPAVDFFRTLDDYPSFDDQVDKEATHPSNSSRIKRLQSQLNRRQRPSERNAVLEESFQRIRPSILSASVAEKINDIDFIGAIIQLRKLIEVSGETEATNCAGGNIFYSMAMLNPDLYSHLIEIYLEASDTAGGTVVYEAENARSALLASAASFYRKALAHSKQSDCGLRGIGLINHALKNYHEASAYLEDYIISNSNADDLPFIQSVLGLDSSSDL